MAHSSRFFEFAKLKLMIWNLFFVFLTLPLEIICSSGGFYADNGLHQSVKYKPLGKHERKELQTEILHLLGMHSRPRPKHHDLHVSGHKYLLDLYEQVSNETGEENNLALQRTTEVGDSDAIVSFVNKVNHKFPRLRHEKDQRLWFDVSETPIEGNIISAQLHLYRNRTQSSKKNDGIYILSLYTISEESPTINSLHRIHEQSIGKANFGWLIINITSPVLQWIENPTANYGLYLKIKSADTSHYVHSKEIGILSTIHPEEYEPFVIAYFKQWSPSPARIRTKRAPRKKSEQSHEEETHNPYTGYTQVTSKRNCQRWTLYVSFKDLGWEDWIIAPDGYGAFYCQGFCSFPLNAHMNATNHAIVQTLVHLMDPSKVPKSCCAPTALSAITVLYFDDNSNVILKRYKNMVVKSCGCH